MTASELVDVIDDSDRVTGCVSRAEMRRQRLLHRCVYILLFDSKERLFVHRRTEGKDVFPGYWDVAVGGVVASGESYDEAAAREAEEEVGLTGVALVRLFELVYEDEGTRVRGVVYRCVSDAPLRLQAEEVAEGRWVDRIELEGLMAQRRFCPDGLAVLAEYEAQRLWPARA